MKILKFILPILLSNIIFAQIEVEYLNDVPQSFKDKYYSQPRVYNPLHVGDMWQYYFEDFTFPFYRTTKVLQDSVINGRRYYKKNHFQLDLDSLSSNFITWERNDSVSGVSFMLDFQDANENGDFLDELPLDSLENPYWSRYATYKYSFNISPFWSGQKTVLVEDTSWVKIEGDTVISRYFEILELFWGEEIADKFGVWSVNSESPRRYLTGAIINGKKYGTVVSVKNGGVILPSKIDLANNYPNPFNPSTTINYSIPANQEFHSKTQNVQLIVHDILGNKIAVLVNEPKAAGNYSVNFNAAHLSSGIYYYSLITNSKKITKPMVLIK